MKKLILFCSVAMMLSSCSSTNDSSNNNAAFSGLPNITDIDSVVVEYYNQNDQMDDVSKAMIKKLQNNNSVAKEIYDFISEQLLILSEDTLVDEFFTAALPLNPSSNSTNYLLKNAIDTFAADKNLIGAYSYGIRNKTVIWVQFADTVSSTELIGQYPNPETDIYALHSFGNGFNIKYDDYQDPIDYSQGGSTTTTSTTTTTTVSSKTYENELKYWENLSKQSPKTFVANENIASKRLDLPAYAIYDSPNDFLSKIPADRQKRVYNINTESPDGTFKYSNFSIDGLSSVIVSNITLSFKGLSDEYSISTSFDINNYKGIFTFKTVNDVVEITPTYYCIDIKTGRIVNFSLFKDAYIVKKDYRGHITTISLNLSGVSSELLEALRISGLITKKTGNYSFK